MSRLDHGMRSKQILIPGESAAELDELRRELFETIDPQDAVEEMLAERVFLREWYRLRGERATTDRTATIIDEIVDGADDRDAQEVDRLAPLVEAGDRAALRELRAFPGGVAYLLREWTIIQSRLAQDRNLLGTQRLRCFRLLGTFPEMVLRDDPVATKWLRSQLGVMLAPEADLAQVAGFLGVTPPEGMEQAEFAIRVTQMRDSLKPKQESFLELRSYVAEVIAELQAHQLKIEQGAAPARAGGGRGRRRFDAGGDLPHELHPGQRKRLRRRARRLRASANPNGPARKAARGSRSPRPSRPPLRPMLKTPSRPRCRPAMWQPRRRPRRRRPIRMPSRVS